MDGPMFRYILDVLLVWASVMRSRGTSVPGDRRVTLTEQSSCMSKVVTIEHGRAVTGRIKNGRSLLLEEGDIVVLNALM
jgi:hypothetical protein